MCVILDIEPNVEIPFEKIQSACTVNSDGWGAMVVDRGRVIPHKVFNPNGNDPDEVMKYLEQSKGLRTFLHLRYRTAGTKNLDACHPFCVTGHKHDGHDLYLMHNGTLSRYSCDKSQLPDSYHFARQLVRPLFLKFARAQDPDTVLDDPLFQDILTTYTGASSKVLLVDQNGNTFTVNRSGGVQFDGWWASNGYSFNSNHRSSSFRTYSGGYSNGYYDRYTESFDDKWDSRASTQAHANAKSEYDKRASTQVTVTTTTNGTSSSEKPAQSGSPSGASATVVNPLSTPLRETFASIAGLDDISEVVFLKRRDIRRIVNEYPDYAVLLIQDLIDELWTRDEEWEADDEAPAEDKTDEDVPFEFQPRRAA